jgi:starvation-inducible DNA-binding protein
MPRQELEPRRRRAERPTSVEDGLQDVLRTTFQVYRDLHLAHFNVTGPQFPQLHALFEQQYQEVWEAMDEVAERIRALGAMVSPDAFTVSEAQLPADAEGMVRHLMDLHRQAARMCERLQRSAEDAGDPGSGDIALGRVRAHQKHAWMLEATLGGQS